MEALTIIKLVCLFLAIWWTIVNATRVYYKLRIPAFNIFIQAIGIFGFIVIQFNLF